VTAGGDPAVWVEPGRGTVCGRGKPTRCGYVNFVADHQVGPEHWRRFRGEHRRSRAATRPLARGAGRMRRTMAD